MPGFISGGPRLILRLEGLLVLIAGCVLYSTLDSGWGVFFLCFLLPDLSFLGYLGGAKTGALCYNCAHSYSIPLLLWLAGTLLTLPWLLTAACIWACHIGFDRALGYGLKYSQGFGFTHLGPIGKQREAAE